MLNTFPRWKYGVLVVSVLIGLIYALPNLYGEDPAIQVTDLKTSAVTEEIAISLDELMTEKSFQVKSREIDNGALLIRFKNTEHQLRAKDDIKSFLGSDYSVALNLAPVTPSWLSALGAKPMKLGLDLRGGVHFLMEVDVETSIQRRVESYLADARKELRTARVRYQQFRAIKNDSLIAYFDSTQSQSEALSVLKKRFPELEINKVDENNRYSIVLRLSPAVISDIRQYTLEQTMTTLRNRINELGVAEAIVQRHGTNQVIVELPGVQDTARAKDILGKTATLDFMMEDHENDLSLALKGKVPPGSRLFYDKSNRPVLLKKRVILTGDAITGAHSGYDSKDNRPNVSVRLGGASIGLFRDTTKKNVGKRMAVVYKESYISESLVNGKVIKQPKTRETVISLATIQQALGTQFQITNLSKDESRDLAILLRAGALPATISIVEEKIVGPSMGQDNIRMGMISVGVGLSLVLLFMTFYYSVFGVIANLALLLNLVLLVALMSLIGATLTLPGIAGIVLTLGMAVDANVLIFERIREEIRSGMSPQASIHRGFEHAFSTIVDANLTTLIVGVILFAIGTGPVKGFAVTLSIGILTSMFTAITGTRAMVNFVYGGKPIKRLLVGI